MEQDDDLQEETFDMAATRPELLFGVPYSLAAALMLTGVLFCSLYSTGHLLSDSLVDAVFLVGVAMFWSAAKVLLRADFHGWDVFIAWCRLDARLLDTAENGGAALPSFPMTSVYRCEVYGHAE